MSLVFPFSSEWFPLHICSSQTRNTFWSCTLRSCIVKKLHKNSWQFLKTIHIYQTSCLMIYCLGRYLAIHQEILLTRLPFLVEVNRIPFTILLTHHFRQAYRMLFDHSFFIPDGFQLWNPYGSFPFLFFIMCLRKAVKWICWGSLI